MPKWSTAGGLAAFVFLVIAFLVPAVLDDPSLDWLLSMGALAAFAASVGVAINGRPAGLIIDNRNRVSLSKLQAAAWTLLVLSAFVTGVTIRIRLGFADPVAVVIPQELLAAMGISATSLVAAPLVLSVKAGGATDKAKEKATAEKIGDNPATLKSAGDVYARAQPADAQWLDMFRGEEVSNAGSPDLSKVQQFLITVVVLVVYGAALWKVFAGPEYITDETAGPSFFAAFPPLSSSMVWLIAISHAGYLAYKAAPHSGPKK